MQIWGPGGPEVRRGAGWGRRMDLVAAKRNLDPCTDEVWVS